MTLAQASIPYVSGKTVTGQPLLLGNVVGSPLSTTPFSSDASIYGIDLTPVVTDVDAVAFYSSSVCIGIATVNWNGTEEVTLLTASRGSGIDAVTITVNDGVNPIQNATVELTINSSVYTNKTNSSGVAVLAPNEGDGTYGVKIIAGGYQFTPTTLVVSGNTPETYSMTAISISPSSPGFVTLWGTCYDNDGNPQAGVIHTLALIQVPLSGAGLSLSKKPRSVQSNGIGVVEFTQAIIGGKYDVSRANGNVESIIAVDQGGGLMEFTNLLS